MSLLGRSAQMLQNSEKSGPVLLRDGVEVTLFQATDRCLCLSARRRFLSCSSTIWTYNVRMLHTCCFRHDARRLLWQSLLRSETQHELWRSDSIPPWCFRVPNTMVPLFSAGVDLNTFGFRRVFSFTSPCHWRYCPLSPEARPCQCTKSRVHNTIWNQIHLPAALCHHDSIFDTLQRKTFPSAPSLLVHRLHWLVWFGASQDIPFHWYFRIVKTNAFLTTDNRDV